MCDSGWSVRGAPGETPKQVWFPSRVRTFWSCLHRPLYHYDFEHPYFPQDKTGGSWTSVRLVTDWCTRGSYPPTISNVVYGTTVRYSLFLRRLLSTRHLLRETVDGRDLLVSTGRLALTLFEDRPQCRHYNMVGYSSVESGWVPVRNLSPSITQYNFGSLLLCPQQTLLYLKDIHSGLRI